MPQQIIIPNRGTVTQNLPVPTDLIAWYRFEETAELAVAIDWAMNFNTAVNDERSADGLFGQGLPTYKTGKDNFKGLILLNEIPSSQEITVEFWVKLAKELTMGEHRTYTLFSKKWVSGMQWYAYFVTRLEVVQLHCCFSYLVADEEAPSIQVKGATWDSLLANGVYYKKSTILYEHAEHSDWRLFYDSDDSKWKIQNLPDGEEDWVTHFESATVAGTYTTTPYGKGTAVSTGVEEVSDLAVISLPYAKADEWTRVVLPLKLRESLPSSFGIYYGDYSSVRLTTQIVDIPVNTDIDPQLIGEQSQLMLCTNDPSIPYIIDGHPLPTSARYGIEGILDEVKVWRSLVKTVPVISAPTLTVNVEGLGSVDIDPDKAEYDWNEEVVLEAVPAGGQSFEEWQGDVPEGEETTNPLTIYMDGDKDITAVFSGKCATPQFSPDGGSYDEAKSVAISCATSGVTIHYTTDGSDPDDGDPVYSSPIAITETTTLKAIAYKDGYDPSDIKTGVYTLTVKTPVFDPVAGSYSSGTMISITCGTPGVTIYYTTDGSDPTELSDEYTDPIELTADMTLKAKAYKTGWTASAVKSGDYIAIDNWWTQKADFGGTARTGAVAFSIGSKGYVGTGRDSVVKKDFWEYDPTGNTWTQKADFGGNGRYGASGFSVGTKGYIGCGSAGGTYKKDFWEYDPSIDVWTQKADFGGIARLYAIGIGTSIKGYIGCGQYSATFFKDFWEYDPTGNTWTQKADFGGTSRSVMFGFSIDDNVYAGTGWNSSTSEQDFWMFDPNTNIWAAKTDYPALTHWGVGFSIGSKGYGGLGQNSGLKKDFYEYVT